MQFEKLDVWKQRSARLASNVYKLMATCKDYGFKDQITRSALSIPSNIAEGGWSEKQIKMSLVFYIMQRLFRRAINTDLYRLYR